MSRILTRPRIVDNEIFEGGNDLQVILVQRSGFVSRMSELGATPREVQRCANHKADADTVYLTIGRQLDLTRRGMNDATPFFPNDPTITELFAKRHEASAVTLRKHDRNVALCTAIMLPTKREPDQLMKDIKIYENLKDTVATLDSEEHHDYFKFASLIGEGNLRLIDQLISQSPRPRLRTFLAKRRRQLVGHLEDWYTLAEHFGITEVRP
ncbi:MAG: hypothetical protein GY833_23130 [Aestuariibacter sp.]|nr:hypothetical protein [Aestuariibacter sp.]